MDLCQIIKILPEGTEYTNTNTCLAMKLAINIDHNFRAVPQAVFGGVVPVASSRQRERGTKTKEKRK